MTSERNTLALTTSLYEGLAEIGAGGVLLCRAVVEGGLTLLGRAVLGAAPEHLEAAEVVVPVVGPGGKGLTIEATLGSFNLGGTIPHPDGHHVPLHAVRIIDHRVRLLLPGFDGAGDLPVVFDRQIRAFGPAGQVLLQHLRIGVGGGGGTGSAVCEQLIRLGVGTIIVIDDDAINDDGSNVTRVYGSTMADIGMPKVDLVERQASSIGLGTTVIPIKGTINDEAVARQLRGCDLIFGCTDDNLGRSVLSRLAYWYLVPVIDIGVQLDSTDGHLRSIDGRITYVAPGFPCLFCRGRIDLEAMHTEGLPEPERSERIEEGYARGLAERDPAVVAYTTAVAAMAVAEMMARLFDLDTGTPAAELLLQFHFREIRTPGRTPVDGHFCAVTDNIGAGDTRPFLGRMWTS